MSEFLSGQVYIEVTHPDWRVASKSWWKDWQLVETTNSTIFLRADSVDKFRALIKSFIWLRWGHFNESTFRLHNTRESDTNCCHSKTSVLYYCHKRLKKSPRDKLQRHVGRRPNCFVIQVSSRQHALQFYLTLKTVYGWYHFFIIFDKRNQS